jgi:hypothetical protein
LKLNTRLIQHLGWNQQRLISRKDDKENFMAWDEDIVDGNITQGNYSGGYSSPTTFRPNTFTPSYYTPSFSSPSYADASNVMTGSNPNMGSSYYQPTGNPTFGLMGNVGGGSNDSEFYNLPNRQANAAMSMGERVSQLGDPAQAYRPSWAKMLDETIKGQGSFSSSPAYQFAYNQGLEAVNRKYAKDLGSGARGQALQDYGMNAASQLRNAEIDRLTRLTGSPGATANAMARMYQDAWDRQQMALANKNQVQNPRQQAPVQQGQQGQSSMNTLMDMYSRMNAGGSSGSTGGTSMVGGYDGSYGAGGYTPVSSAGTGYVASDYGTYDFGTRAPNDSFYTPSAGYDYVPDYGNSIGYDPYSDYGNYGGDTGVSDYIDYGYYGEE